MNSPLDVLNWSLLFISLAGMSIMLRSLSRRLGEALRVRRYYLAYDVSIIILAIAIAGILVSYWYGRFALAFRLLFLVGVVPAVAATIRYWGWTPLEIFLKKK